MPSGKHGYSLTGNAHGEDKTSYNKVTLSQERKLADKFQKIATRKEKFKLQLYEFN